MVLSLFWRVVVHYRWARLRARRVALAEALAEGRAFDGQSHLEEGADASDAVRELWEDAHDDAGRILYHHMSELGGLWVKTGQYLASRADMVPKALGRHLAAMLDSNRPRPLAEVVTTLLDELGEAKLAHIASIDPTPLSTASIAQVHLATLVDGRRVVLKLQHVEVRARAHASRRLLASGSRSSPRATDMPLIATGRDADCHQLAPACREASCASDDC